MSKRERQDIIDRLLGDARDEQRGRNDEWKRIAGTDDEPREGQDPSAG